MKIGKLVPSPIKRLLEKFQDILDDISYIGNRRFCPVCERQFYKFADYGPLRRKEAKCHNCGALERHRLVWLFFKRKTNLFGGARIKMLHVAPEPVFESLLKKQLGKNYITADLYDPRAMVKMDITDIRYPDASFDVIYCSHVLEHVDDDRQAMREFFRVLKPGGWAVLLVPVTVEETFEDPWITDPKERLKVFGHDEHVRSYGPDYIDRLREAGFEVELVTPVDFLLYEEIIRMGITKDAGDVYFCRKK